MKRTIEVKKKHIDEGKQLDPCNCPVALALKDYGLHDPHVDMDLVYHGKGETMINPYWTALPPEVKEFIIKFDKKGVGKPFSFDIYATRI